MEPMTIFFMVLVLGFYGGGFIYFLVKAMSSKHNTEQ
jgi:hypothetical protein